MREFEAKTPDEYLFIEADPESGKVLIKIVDDDGYSEIYIDRVTAHRLGRFLNGFDRRAWEDD